MPRARSRMRQSAAAKIANVWTGSAGSLSARAGVFTQNFRHCFGSREVNEYSPAPVSKRARAISKGTYHAAFPYVVAVWQVDSENGAKHQNDDAQGANSGQNARQDCQAAEELG